MMKRRILIYGGTDLSAAESRFAERLTYTLLQQIDSIIITGGFLSSKKNPGAISTDHSVLEGAIKYANEKRMALSECLETWLPDTAAETDPRKKDVERFREGQVKELQGESARARRFLMVKDVDALITVKGKKNTAIALDFALTINKPALPLPFTGGDSLDYWQTNKTRIINWFDIDDSFAKELQVEKLELLTFQLRDHLIEKIVRAVSRGLQKELSNAEQYDQIQKGWDVKETQEAQVIIPKAAGDVKRNHEAETKAAKPLKLFLSYSHKDESLKDQLDKHLTALKRSNKISVWNDRRLRGGEEWDDTIKEELQHADIILLLVSLDFIRSEYIWNYELNAAIERHKQGSCKVIPIFLSEGDYKDMPFEKLQGYPKDAIPVTSFPPGERDKIFLEIVNGLREDIAEMINR
jgi:hypothetical protein